MKYMIIVEQFFFFKKQKNKNGYIASWLANCAWKPKIPVSSPADSYV